MEVNLTAETVPLADPVERAVDLLATTRSPGVVGDEPWPEAGRKVIRFHLARMLSRVPGVIAGEDPEEVHAMRVASRRVRAAWRVFGDGFERGAARRNRRDLRGVGVRRHLEERVDRHNRRFDRVWQPIVTPRYRARLGRALNSR